MPGIVALAGDLQQYDHGNQLRKACLNLAERRIMSGGPPVAHEVERGKKEGTTTFGQDPGFQALHAYNVPLGPCHVVRVTRYPAGTRLVERMLQGETMVLLPPLVGTAFGMRTAVILHSMALTVKAGINAPHWVAVA